MRFRASPLQRQSHHPMRNLARRSTGFSPTFNRDYTDGPPGRRVQNVDEAC
jgi:hypothetical protein